MNSQWWNLPSSYQFVSDITADIKQGKNVVCFLPKHLPENNIKHRICEDMQEYCRIDPLNIDNWGLEPIELLFEEYLDHNDDIQYDLKSLINSEGFQEKIIYVESLPQKSWEKWIKFLDKYEKLCREIPLKQRTIFCFILEGLNPEKNSPQEEVALSIHKWTNIIKYRDKLLFASYCFEGSSIPLYLLDLAISVTVKVADWDYELYMMLSDLRIEEILSPEHILEEMNNNRNWKSDYLLLDENSRWAEGMLDHGSTHSALLLYSQKDNLNKLIWSGELMILFPFIEEKKIIILERYKSVIEKIKTKQDNELIEIKDLHNYVKHNSSMFNNKNLEKMVQIFRNMRNKLAHLEKVELKHLLAIEFEKAESIINEL